MKKYVFITPEILQRKPFFDSPEPEYPDIQIFNFDRDESIEDAIKDLIELNENVAGNQCEKPINCLRIEKTIPQNIWAKNDRNKKNLAS